MVLALKRTSSAGVLQELNITSVIMLFLFQNASYKEFPLDISFLDNFCRVAEFKFFFFFFCPN